MVSVHPAVLERLQSALAHPERADPLVAQWLRRIAAFADRSLRRTALAQLIEEADDASLLAVLHRLEDRARGGDAACRALTAELALSPSLADLPPDRAAELAAAARAAGLERLAVRLGINGPPATAEPRNPHLDQSPGQRTAAARGVNRHVLDRLLHDRDPRVIAALLDNPRVIEIDVVRIAAMRPTSAAILGLVASHLRWGARYRVRKALAFNPASPLSLSRPLIATLLRQDLLELEGSGVLPKALRAEVQSLLNADPD